MLEIYCYDSLNTPGIGGDSTLATYVRAFRGYIC
jgi:hypothetical protein